MDVRDDEYEGGDSYVGQHSNYLAHAEEAASVADVWANEGGALCGDTALEEPMRRADDVPAAVYGAARWLVQFRGTRGGHC